MARTATSGTTTDEGPPASCSCKARWRCSCGGSFSSLMDRYSPFCRATVEHPCDSMVRYMEPQAGCQRGDSLPGVTTGTAGTTGAAAGVVDAEGRGHGATAKGVGATGGGGGIGKGERGSTGGTWGSITAHPHRLKRQSGEESAFFWKTSLFHVYRSQNK